MALNISGIRRLFAVNPAAALMLSILTGCGNTADDPRGIRMTASGTVLLDARPLPAARILFNCASESGTVRATALVEDGEFHFDKSGGPLIGHAQVKIYPVEMELAELEAAREGDPQVFVNPIKVWIPQRYNTRSTLAATVTEDPETNKFEFHLTSDR